MTTVRFESENYYFQFYSLNLKPEYANQSDIITVVKDLEALTGFAVVRIYNKDINGRPINLYNNKPVKYPADHDSMSLTDFIINNGNLERILHCEDHHLDKNNVMACLSKYFNGNQNIPISEVRYINQTTGNSYKISKLKKSLSAQKRTNLFHGNSEDSPIEMTFENALIKGNISYLKQQEVFDNGALLTILDFLITDPLIAIYCDGYNYHYDKLSVLKDRKQDRMLQLLGYNVLRFTGSEIHEDPEQCIKEIKRFIDKYKTKI